MIVLTGSLIRDAESKTVGDKTVVNFSLVQKAPRDSKQSVFLNVSMWPTTEAQITMFSSLTKGTVVAFPGARVNYSANKEEGDKTTINVGFVANNLEILSSGVGGASADSSPKPPAPSRTVSTKATEVSWDG
jgi:single-stranded DNA-binding protein